MANALLGVFTFPSGFVLIASERSLPAWNTPAALFPFRCGKPAVSPATVSQFLSCVPALSSCASAEPTAPTCPLLQTSPAYFFWILPTCAPPLPFAGVCALWLHAQLSSSPYVASLFFQLPPAPFSSSEPHTTPGKANVSGCPTLQHPFFFFILLAWVFRISCSWLLPSIAWLAWQPLLWSRVLWCRWGIWPPLAWWVQARPCAAILLSWVPSACPGRPSFSFGPWSPFLAIRCWGESAWPFPPVPSRAGTAHRPIFPSGPFRPSAAWGPPCLNISFAVFRLQLPTIFALLLPFSWPFLLRTQLHWPEYFSCYQLIDASDLLFGQLFGSLFVEISQLNLLLECLDFFILANQFFQLDAPTHLLVLASLQLLSQLLFGDLEVDTVGCATLSLVETCRGHIEFVTYQYDYRP